ASAYFPEDQIVHLVRQGPARQMDARVRAHGRRASRPVDRVDRIGRNAAAGGVELRLAGGGEGLCGTRGDRRARRDAAREQAPASGLRGQFQI
ncbi:MAG: NADH-ubiquinone oxidoreductase-related protein, partial [uncultured Sphingomonadaceae bacterium]